MAGMNNMLTKIMKTHRLERLYLRIIKIELSIESDEIDVEGGKIIGQGLKDCANILEINLGITHISTIAIIGNNKIGDEGANEIAVSLKASKTLSKLYLSNFRGLKM